jgi:glucosyl-3-phosphoglycerate synthase
MPDFFQHARLPTLHHLADTDLFMREGELAVWTKDRPLALLLPALYSEFQKPALARIHREMKAAFDPDRIFNRGRLVPGL